MIWYFLLAVHFIVEILGFLSHIIFMYSVVFQGIMDVYCRIGLGMISSSMIVMLLSYLLESLVCLSIGTVFEDDQCAQLPMKTILLCIHRYAEALSLSSQLFFTIERVLSIQYSRSHRSYLFKSFFIFGIFLVNAFSFSYMYTNAIIGEGGIFWLITFQVAVISNFPLVYYAKKISNKKYKADVKIYSLKRKHNLYNSYEIARSFLYSGAFYMISQLACFFLLWMFIAGFIFDGNFQLFPKLFFVISLIWNFNLAAFPWIVMLIHRSQRERIYRVWAQMFPETKTASKILGMNGKEMVTTPTQNDYFNQLHKSISFYSTAIFAIILVLLLAPFTFVLSSQLSYHAFIVISPQSTLNMYWVNVIWLSVSVLSFCFNAIVMSLAIDPHHDRLENNILAVDSRFQYIIDNYAPYIISMKTATIPMNILLLEGIWAAILFTIIVFYAAYRVFYSLYKNSRIVSERVTNAQKNIVITLSIYCITFFGLIGFPTVGASSAMVMGADYKYIPFAGLYFISISVPGILFCIINIITVSPYRRAIRNLFNRLIHLNTGQSSTATISENRAAAVAPLPQSLFTQRPIEPENAINGA